MKFLGGVIIGILTTIMALFLIDGGNGSNDTLSGLTIFPEKGECITKNKIEIFQTIKPSMALARHGRSPNDKLVLLINHEDKSYYDKQEIPIPPKMCARQIGIYQYMTNGGRHKTVPVVIIE